CVLAEWQLLRSRLVRSRLGIWLLLLGAAGVWLAARGGPLTVLAPHVGMLGAVLGVAFTAGSDADRAALSLILTHPTTPLPLAAGRRLAALPAASALARAGTLTLELLPGVWRYAALERGDPVGWIHAACWAVGGVAGTARLLARRAL